ncbi:response regulator [Niallia sp.]|uniref:response regulator n=1 Tax=Niallia sp. TaxID=2837523 RepID=UPI00289C5679|nr:response regulator [Niallia sp.]
MDKYKAIFITRITHQLKILLNKKETEIIKNKEVYALLNSIQGTSDTLDLDLLFHLVSSLMKKIEPRKVDWTQSELKAFLSELLDICEEYEHFHEEINRIPDFRDTEVPLIQLIDDDISLLIFLKEMMENKGWMVIANSNAEHAIEQFYSMQPDCIIIDINLPNKTGLDVLEDIQKHTKHSFVPKIICSIDNSREKRIAAYKKGADDYFEKPLDMEEFLIRIERHIERKKIFDQSVLIDELTEVYNRKFLKDSYNRFISDVIRTKMSGTIAIIDIDHFKKVNDVHGHVVGDKILKEFAKFLKNNIRSTDTLFRYGGEEFVIFFQRAIESDVADVLNRMLKRYSEMFFEADGERLSLTFSAGVYEIDSGDVPLKKALEIVDEALYLAKENGRACIKSANKMKETPNKKLLNISIVDDDLLSRSILKNILDSIEIDNLAINITEYEDGIQFLESNRLQENGMHFLILDGIMPVMDGLELLQIVKKTAYQHNAHILMLTGRKSEHDIAEALRLGADDYVTKPFSMKELQARIIRLITRMI